MSDTQLSTDKNTYRARVLMIGGAVGTVLGIISAIMYLRAYDEVHEEDGTPAAPEAGDAVKLGVALLGIMRTITEWAQRT
jgi:uncharacterized membrane protein